MLVKLKDLKPNRFRDFAVDPIDKEHVASLTKSIKDNDFWGGIVARKTAAGLENVAGEHRLRAAIEAGIEKADIYVAPLGKMSDADAIRIYATENATQRGENGSAIAGSVASVIKFIARAILTGNVSTYVETISNGKLGQMRRRLESDGIGEPIILEFLHNIPGITTRTVRDQIANLKASGIYDRLIGEVQAEFVAAEKAAAEAAEKAEAERKAAADMAKRAEAERKAAAKLWEQEREAARKAKEKRDKEIAAEKETKAKQRLKEQAEREAEKEKRAEEKRKADEVKAKERAKADAERAKKAEAEAKEKEAAAAKAKAEKEAADKAKQAAAEQERQMRAERKAFDFEGVTAVLKDANYVNLFRELVTAIGISPYVARDEQAELAKRLLKAAKEEPEDKFKHRRDDPTRFPGFMREFVLTLAVRMQKEKSRINREQEKEAQRADKYRQAEQKLEMFWNSIRSAKSQFFGLVRLAKDAKMNPAQHLTFRQCIDAMLEVMEECRKQGFNNWDGEDDVVRATRTSVNGRYHKMVAHLSNTNEGERHNAADLLHEAARRKGTTVPKLLGIE